ncbi:replication initiation protein [Caballeronia sp. RCC_10]|uniref:replication initiation protein n=1 Tax=Caballeronia sp. RCC_10 TaxID=3239227 RepID=UPI0035258A58
MTLSNLAFTHGNRANALVKSPSIEEFQDAMDASPAYRANFKELRKRVIEPSVKELLDKNGPVVKWEPVKAGRKVVRLRFEFEPDPQGALF